MREDLKKVLNSSEKQLSPCVVTYCIRSYKCYSENRYGKGT